jgi:drug/metabolite transporter (DMT)-like permease
MFAIGCSFSYGLFSVLGKKKDYDRYVSMMFYYLFSSIFSAIPVLIYSGLPRISTIQLTGVVWLGVFANGIAFVFWFLALKYGDTAKMSNIVFLTPFLSLVYIYFLLGEEILVTSLLGLIFIVLGIFIQYTGKNRLPPRNIT